jgi:uncharacterized membrane protein
LSSRRMQTYRIAVVKTYALLAATVVFNSVGNVFLSAGMKHTGSLNAWKAGEVLRFFFRALSTATIWLGIAMLLLFFAAYLMVLSRADYSYVSPATAAGYALVPLLGYTLLGETVPPIHWLGIALICAGVALVGGTPPRTTVKERG